jgi:hypothetical protein
VYHFRFELNILKQEWDSALIKKSLQQLEQGLVAASGHGLPCITYMQERAATRSKNYLAGVIFTSLQ